VAAIPAGATAPKRLHQNNGGKGKEDQPDDVKENEKREQDEVVKMKHRVSSACG
jgi:hypothetical protein